MLQSSHWNYKYILNVDTEHERKYTDCAGHGVWLALLVTWLHLKSPTRHISEFLCECFQRGLVIEGKPTLNVNSIIPCVWIPDWTKRRNGEASKTTGITYCFSMNTIDQASPTTGVPSPSWLTSLLWTINQIQPFLHEVTFCQIFDYNTEKSNW